ncbi:MAG: T9SS type A sorting domain-containing protein [Chitinophagaceae bacterium]|nr:T9SS type A sorting domain-containing protein [Chitinophagaceae bacterium]
MKPNNKIFLISIFLIASLLGKAQTIDYAYEPFSTMSCNIFASAVTVDNYEHRTALSRPKFSDESVVLRCKTNGSTSSLATIYSINYGFKAGYNYKISVYYKGDKDVNDGFYPLVGLKISTTDGGIDDGTNCIDPSAYSTTNINTFDMSIANSSYAWKADLIDVTLTQNANYLLVGAFPYVGTTKFANIFIRKIQIVETAPAVSFTLAPATLNVTCGSSMPQTFTVTNVHSTPGVTAYHWSLGSSPNGWIYNGNPAPATIQTSANTLTLTPACQLTHSDISVSVTAGGNNYPGANTAAITGSSPSYTLTGDDIICSGNKSYALNTLPCGSSVSWTSSKPGLASVSASGNPAILTRNGSGSGTVTLTGTISGGCGSSSISKTITVGAPPSSSLYADWDMPNKIIAGADEVVNATAYKWYVDNVYIKSTSYYNTSLPYYGSCSTNVIVAVEAVTPCGASSKTSTNIGTPPCSYFMITPNPAQESISIMPDVKSIMTAKAGQPAAVRDNLRQVKIIDGSGTVVKTMQWANPVRDANIGVADLAPGLYFVEITGERGRYTQKLIISR